MYEDSYKSPGPPPPGSNSRGPITNTYEHYSHLTERDTEGNNKDNAMENGTIIQSNAIQTLTEKNLLLAKENKVLRQFLLLKKENCDLKTVDIITSALTMCDEKLSEFISNLHNSTGQQKLVSFASIFREKARVESIAHGRINSTLDRSPSYGPSFAEVQLGDLDTMDDDVFTPDSENYEYQSQKRTNNNIKISFDSEKRRSESYGATFPEVHLSELGQIDGSVLTHNSTQYEHQHKKMNDYNRDTLHGGRYDTNSSYDRSFRELNIDELKADSTPMLTSTKREQDKSLSQPLNLSSHKERLLENQPKLYPQSTSTPSPQASSIPLIKRQATSSPASIKQPSFKPILQPHMGFSMEKPRQYPRKSASPSYTNANTSDIRRNIRVASPTSPNKRADKNPVNRPAMSPRFTSKDMSPGTVLYDSLEQTEFENQDDSSESSLFPQSDDTITHRRISSSQINDQTLHGVKQVDETMRNASRATSPNKHTIMKMENIAKGLYTVGPDTIRMQSPATGNGNSSVRNASPIYVSSGQQTTSDVLSQAKTSNTDRLKVLSFSPIQTTNTSFRKSPVSQRFLDTQDDESINTQGQTQQSTRLNDTFSESTVKETATVQTPSTYYQMPYGGKALGIKPNMQVKRPITATVGRTFHSDMPLNHPDSVLKRSATYTPPGDTPDDTDEGYVQHSPRYLNDIREDHNDDSTWVKITTRAKIMNQDYNVQYDPNILENRTVNEVSNDMHREIKTQTTVKSKQLGSPRYTSTPVQPHKTKQTRHISDSRQEFDRSLVEALILHYPVGGNSEKVKSILYRPVDTLTGYRPDVTQDITNMVLDSSPNSRLVGEIAFQLDRRIMELVLGPSKNVGDKARKRNRYYGYSMVNIMQLIKNQTNVIAHGNPDRAKLVEQALLDRLDNINEMLRPLGYNSREHSAFTQDVVNRYGLMKEAPDHNTIVGFGLCEPVVLRMLLGRLLGQCELLDNMMILLDCLCYLSHSDSNELFMW